MKHSISPVLFSLLIAACSPSHGPDSSSQAKAGTGIVGGVEVKKASIEARATVVLINQNDHEICTATLIADDVAITAAHCVSSFADASAAAVASVKSGSRVISASTDPNEPPPYVERKDGAPDLHPVTVKNEDLKIVFSLRPMSDPNADMRDVLEVKVHEQYRPMTAEPNDLALVRFKGKRPTGTLLAKLPTVTDVKLSKDKPFVFTAVGYGRKDGLLNVGADASANDDGPGGAGLLRKTILMAEFNSAEPNNFRVNQTNGHGVCFGDSGGPALLTSFTGEGSAIIIGVAANISDPSNDDKTADSYDFCLHSSTYMNLVKYRDWIEATLRSLQEKKK